MDNNNDITKKAEPKMPPKKTYVRTKQITDQMVSDWTHQLAGGVKRKEICEKYKISMPTLRKYCGTKSEIDQKFKQAGSQVSEVASGQL